MSPATDSTLALSVIGQIAVPVRDVARAVAFYRDTLRMRFLFDAPPHLAFFDCSGVRLMLSKPEHPDLEPPGSVLYFKVPDIRGAHRALLERGASFEDEPHLIAKMPDHELWMVFFRDSEGNLLGLMSEVR